MADRPKIPVEVFRQLRDKPNFTVESWLARRVFRYAGLGVKARTKLRFLLLDHLSSSERTDWECALRVVRSLRHMQGIAAVDYISLRETDEVLGLEWYRDAIMPSSGKLPHMMVRTRADVAEVIHPVINMIPVGGLVAPYRVEEGRAEQFVLVVQGLTAYLGGGSLSAVDRDRLLRHLFGDTREVPADIRAEVMEAKEIGDDE